MATFDLWNFFNQNQKVPMGNPMSEQGQSGTQSFGGFIVTGERNPSLVGQQRYRTAADILNNFSIVVAGMRGLQTLISMSTWTVVPALDNGKSSSDEAKKAADFVRDIMDNTDISWQRIVRRAALYKFHGFGVHEWVAERRASDGLIGIKTIQMRPCHTIYRWILDDNGHVNGVIQRVPNHVGTIPISRGRFIHMVDDGMTDSPEGIGLWRNLAEPWARMKDYLHLEGMGFERDLRGIPFGKAPLSNMDAAVAAGTMKKEDKQAMLKGFIDFVTMERKSSKTGLIADSTPYKGLTEGGDTVSTVPMWDMKLLTASSTSITDLGKAIERVRFDAAMILGMEHLLLGSTSSGSRALASTKVQQLAMNINSSSRDITSTFSRDFIDPIWDLNGFDPATKPSFRAEDAAFKDVTVVSQALANLALAGAKTPPGDPAVDAVRDLAGLPHQTAKDIQALSDISDQPGDVLPPRPSGSPA